MSEAAGVNSAAGSFGLSFGLAFAGAIMLATLSFAFTDMAENSAVLDPAEQQQVAEALEEDAELMSNTQLDALIVDQPPEVEAEIIRINTEARPLALQVALAIPLLAGLVGLVNAFRMMRLPTPSRRAPPRAWRSADASRVADPPPIHSPAPRRTSPWTSGCRPRTRH